MSSPALRPGCALAAVLLAGAVPAQETTSRAATNPATTAGGPQAPAGISVQRGWLRELLDRDSVAARADYEAVAGNETLLREQRALALARLAELDRAQGHPDRARERGRKIQELGLPLPGGPQGPDPTLVRAIEELRKVATATTESQPEAALTEARQRVRAALGGTQLRALVRNYVRVASPQQQATLQGLRQQLRQAEGQGDSVRAEALRREINDLLGDRAAYWRTRSYRDVAFRIIELRLAGNAHAAARIEEILKGATRPRPGPGGTGGLRGFLREGQEGDPRNFVNFSLRALENFQRTDQELSVPERATLDRCLAKAKELVAKERYAEARELLRPLALLLPLR